MLLQVGKDLDAAMVLLKQQEQICRELRNGESLQISLSNQALVAQALANRDRRKLPGEDGI